MNTDFEYTIKELFGKFEKSDFRINLEKHFFFVCGGPIDTIISSFRQKFITYTATYKHAIYDSIILAETFKDYFKENTYPDLLEFEDDIANISSLIIIFLESPGSLVEFGMFCNNTNLFKKLLVIAPEDKVKNEDSFIFLGPIENIKKKDPSSIAIYPWPDEKVNPCNNDHIIDLIELIEKKIQNNSQSVSFSDEHKGHITFLIYEIIRVSFPILLNEIEISLESMKLKISKSQLLRSIYLLIKLKLINKKYYSGYTYYYPFNKDKSLIKFGGQHIFDETVFRITITQTFTINTSPQARKRKNVMLEIERNN